MFDGDETDARLWEIAENLHRAELTVQERAEHVAEWIRLTDAVQGAFRCATCQERFDAPVWHCQVCAHHWPLKQAECTNCHEGKRPAGANSAQLAPKLKSETNPRGAGRSESGINAAVRELGIDRTEAQRAIKVASIAPAAKEEARKAGIDDNQAALLRIAKEPDAEKQLAAILQEERLESTMVWNDLPSGTLAAVDAIRWARLQQHRVFRLGL